MTGVRRGNHRLSEAVTRLGGRVEARAAGIRPEVYPNLLSCNFIIQLSPSTWYDRIVPPVYMIGCERRRDEMRGMHGADG